MGLYDIQSDGEPSGGELSLLFRRMIREEIKSLGPDFFAQVFAEFPPMRFYTRDEVCRMLRCSVPTFYRLLHDGVFKTVKRGKSLLIRADDFDSKLKNGYIAKYKRY